ncbi:GTP-binding protein [Jiella endophytica]|uniref:GTP-binding protein n=1 Tax=Jiella endophytica TaxID=2558362 RepID=A0A4Y8R8C2_9HYPH|nr:CobW family GTP-binding protein [Jiella endophytica]TFF17855.1 GTP-binding protein [Jiella endophytica]
MSTPDATGPLPVTVIGGFLGAGKTTLVNRLLARGGRRYAVLVNDFGAINVDAKLVQSRDGSKIQLENGCICCSMADGLSLALADVLDASRRPEAILIEASGVADPWKIAEVALVERSLRLELVVALVDAANFARQVEDPLLGDTLVRQLSRADLILLNKMDQAGRSSADRARALILAEAPDARIAETVAAELPADVLFGPTPSPERREYGVTASPRPGEHLPQHDHAENTSQGPAGHDHRHEDAFRRWTFVSPTAFSRAGFEAALGGLPSSLLRLKGWCRFEGDEAGWLLQWVAGRWTLDRDDSGPVGTALVGVGTAALPASGELDALLAAAAPRTPGP